jgi:LDH2 family malate/lactate/ureidoglycolate dehydrogenase
MAVGHDLMGMCMTNSEAIGVPVYGKQAMFGTNPIAYAFPADPIPFLYDAATTVVTRGKVEIYNKTEEPLPDNWAVGQDGKPSNNAGEIIGSIIAKAGGGISPLGGGSELYGGHKGYGLSVIVEIFTSILSQGTTSNYVSLTKDYSGIAHFYMAIDYGLFGDKALIKQNLSAYLRELRESGKAEGQERIYTHGEKEYESREKVLRDGIPANEKTIREIREIAGYHGLDFDSYFA